MTLSDITKRRDTMIDSHSTYTDFILSILHPTQRPGVDTVHLSTSTLSITKTDLMQLYRQVARHFYDHGFEDALQFRKTLEPFNTDQLFKGV